MAKKQRPDINPDDYLDTELGYDMPVKTRAEPAEKTVARKKAATSYNADDYSEAELGYEYEAGKEALK